MNIKFACGIDGTNYKIFQKFGLHYADVIMNIINHYWFTENIADINVTRMINIPKTTGNIVHINNFRPICINNCFLQLYLNIIKYRVEDIINKKINNKQYGFKASTVHLIFMVKSTLELYYL